MTKNLTDDVTVYNSTREEKHDRDFHGRRMTKISCLCTDFPGNGRLSCNGYLHGRPGKEDKTRSKRQVMFMFRMTSVNTLFGFKRLIIACFFVI